jgi:hypothetical protein
MKQRDEVRARVQDFYDRGTLLADLLAALADALLVIENEVPTFRIRNAAFINALAGRAMRRLVRNKLLLTPRGRRHC